MIGLRSMHCCAVAAARRWRPVMDARVRHAASGVGPSRRAASGPRAAAGVGGPRSAVSGARAPPRAGATTPGAGDAAGVGVKRPSPRSRKRARAAAAAPVFGQFTVALVRARIRLLRMGAYSTHARRCGAGGPPERGEVDALQPARGRARRDRVPHRGHDAGREGGSREHRRARVPGDGHGRAGGQARAGQVRVCVCLPPLPPARPPARRVRVWLLAGWLAGNSTVPAASRCSFDAYCRCVCGGWAQPRVQDAAADGQGGDERGRGAVPD